MARAAPATEKGAKGMGCLDLVGSRLPAERTTVETVAHKPKAQTKLQLLKGGDLPAWEI